MEFLKAAADAQALAAGGERTGGAGVHQSRPPGGGGLGLVGGLPKARRERGLFRRREEAQRNPAKWLLLRPRLAVLDETDSGLDIDALKVVAEGINAFRCADNAVVLVTHYQRLLHHVVPDHVHVLSGGAIVRSGDASLALTLEEKGYGWLDG